MFTRISHYILLATSMCVSSAWAAPLESSNKETFDYGWKFSRFGKLPNGQVAEEPGTVSGMAQVSSEESGNKADFAIDGDSSTRWCASDASSGQTLTVNMGKPVNLTQVVIDWEKMENHLYKLEGSLDGKKWFLIEDKSTGENKTESDKTPVKSMKAKFLRLTVLGTGGTNWASVREMTVMDGKKVVKPQPEKAKSEPSPGDPAFNDSQWRALDLPHDWGVEGPFSMDLPNETGKLPWAGIGWYRKSLEVAEASKGKQFYLDFDGVMSRPKVYVNGELAGEWKYGYTPFRVDITPFLKFGQKNTIAVRVDNPPDSSRWYPGGGIYRHVWLTESNPVHVDNWGVYVRTPEISKEQAVVDVDTTVVNQFKSAVKPVVVEEILNDKGDVLAKSSKEGASLAPGQKGTVTSKLTLKTPRLWDINDPYQYKIRTTVLLNDKVVDTRETNFGVRTIEWKPAEGFFLNGRRVQLNGVCQHHDLGPLGGAVHKAGYERQVRILKEMGVNSIRTSHNPPAPELLEICDREGILVIDELFDMWRGAKKGQDYHQNYDKWHEKDLVNFVHRDRNHPSIILWSLGNEVPEQGDPKGMVAKGLHDLFRREDPTRLTTAGCNNAGAAYNGFSDQYDVHGFNYKPWMYKEFKEKRPNQPMVASETSSCVSTRGEYFFPSKEDFWNKDKGFYNFQVSSYDLYAPGWAYRPDVEFAAQDDNKNSAGEYVWTGFDYLGEPTPYNQDTTNALNFRDPKEREEYMKKLKELGNRAPSRSSYFGIVDLCGFKKDRFYIYQAQWRPDVPMAHILPHWNWAEGDNNRMGKVTPVHVYTSGKEAELFLNGKSLGVRKKGMGERDRYRLVWEDVVYEPGELKVVATKDGKKWAEDVVVTTDKPAALTMQVDKDTIAGDGRDLSYVEIVVRDAKGRMVPTAKDQLKFTVTGPAEIVAVCNGDQTDFDSFQKPRIKAFNGMAQVILRSKRGESGEATLTAESESGALKGDKVTVKVTPATPEQLKK